MWKQDKHSITCTKICNLDTLGRERVAFVYSKVQWQLLLLYFVCKLASRGGEELVNGKKKMNERYRIVEFPSTTIAARGCRTLCKLY